MASIASERSKQRNSRSNKTLGKETWLMPLRSVALATLFSLAASAAAAVPEPLRLESLKRCGDLLETQHQDWSLTVRGLGDITPQLNLGTKVIPADTIQREGENLRVRLNSANYQSGPLWLQDGPRASNAAWLTLRNSHVLLSLIHISEPTRPY